MTDFTAWMSWTSFSDGVTFLLRIQSSIFLCEYAIFSQKYCRKCLKTSFSAHYQEYYQTFRYSVAMLQSRT